MSPTQRSLADLRARGYIARTVEYWHAYSKHRIDLWGFDLAAAKPGEFLLVQVTTGTNHAARRSKLAGLDSTPVLKQTPIKLLIHSWAKRGKGKVKRWELREERLA